MQPYGIGIRIGRADTVYATAYSASRARRLRGRTGDRWRYGGIGVDGYNQLLSACALAYDRMVTLVAESPQKMVAIWLAIAFTAVTLLGDMGTRWWAANGTVSTLTSNIVTLNDRLDKLNDRLDKFPQPTVLMNLQAQVDKQRDAMADMNATQSRMQADLLNVQRALGIGDYPGLPTRQPPKRN